LYSEIALWIYNLFIFSEKFSSSDIASHDPSHDKNSRGAHMHQITGQALYFEIYIIENTFKIERYRSRNSFLWHLPDRSQADDQI